MRRMWRRPVGGASIESQSSCFPSVPPKLADRDKCYVIRANSVIEKTVFTLTAMHLFQSSKFLPDYAFGVYAAGRRCPVPLDDDAVARGGPGSVDPASATGSQMAGARDEYRSFQPA